MHQHIDSKNVDEIAKVLIEVYKLCNIQLDNLNSEKYVWNRFNAWYFEPKIAKIHILCWY